MKYGTRAYKKAKNKKPASTNNTKITHEMEVRMLPPSINKAVMVIVLKFKAFLSSLNDRETTHENPTIKRRLNALWMMVNHAYSSRLKPGKKIIGTVTSHSPLVSCFHLYPDGPHPSGSSV